MGQRPEDGIDSRPLRTIPRRRPNGDNAPPNFPEPRVNYGRLHRFIFDGLPVRGALVRLTADWREALARRASVGPFPRPVRALMGEMAAAGVLMQSSIKFDGSLVLQIHGDGPVRLLVAEVRSDLGFRTTASVAAELDCDAGLAELVNAGGNARCAITLDPHHRAPGVLPYQGNVRLTDERDRPLSQISEVIEHYMRHSEQLDTKLVLAANDDVAAGLLLQRMPAVDEERAALVDRDEDFQRLALLTATLGAEELLTSSEDTLLRRLFWEEPLRRFEPQRTRFRCSCSRTRVRDMLIGLGRAEMDSIIAERALVEVGCDFCGQRFHFDAVDIGRMFTPVRDRPPSPRTRQ